MFRIAQSIGRGTNYYVALAENQGQLFDTLTEAQLSLDPSAEVEVFNPLLVGEPEKCNVYYFSEQGRYTTYKRVCTATPEYPLGRVNFFAGWQETVNNRTYNYTSPDYSTINEVTTWINNQPQPEPAPTPAPTPTEPYPYIPSDKEGGEYKPTLAARMPMVGNRKIVQVYCRRVRNKFIKPHVHKKLHPLV